MQKILAPSLLFVSALAFGQAPAPTTLPSDVYFAGASYNTASGSASPVAITAGYAHKALTDNTYPFVLYDAVPNSLKPFSVNNNVSVGVAQKLFTLSLGGHSYAIYGTTGAGPSWQGPDIGWSYHFGATVPFKLGNSLYVLPTFRTQSSSVNNGSGLQLIGGVEFAFGK